MLGVPVNKLIPFVSANFSQGNFYIYQQSGVDWQLKHRQSFSVNYETKSFEFTEDNNSLTLMIEQEEVPFADIEQITLSACGDEIRPNYARYLDSQKDVLDDILYDDHNVIVVHEQAVQVSWSLPDSCGQDLVVSIKANEYTSDERNFLSFPKKDRGVAQYHFGNYGAVNMDGFIQENDGIITPQYSELWRPVTGHPQNYLYLYVQDDAEYVYFSADITPDNTPDQDQDWFQVSIEGADGKVDAFRVSDNNQQFGKCAFGLSSKTSYKHQTCELRIPKALLNSQSIDFSVQYYGTASADSTPPTVTLDSVSSVIHDLTPSIIGFAEDEITPIYQVALYLDGYLDSQTCSADDGSFDGLSENFTCTVNEPLADGEHTINVKAWSDGGASDLESASVSFSIENLNPAIAGFPQVEGTVYASAVSEDGETIYIGGNFQTVNDANGSIERNYLAAIDLDTLLVTDWNPVINGVVYDMEVDGDYVLVGGGFYYDLGDNESQLVKLHQETGMVALGCQPSVIRSGDFSTETIYDIELSSEYIYLGGDFDQVDGVPVSGLARLNRDTCQLDQSWLPHPSGTVRAIETLGNDVLIGGGFDVVNDQYMGELAKLSGEDGSLISECNPNVHVNQGATDTVYDIEADADHIYIGGSFNQVSGTSRNGLARLNNDSTCSLDADWNPELAYDGSLGTAYTLRIDDTDDSLYVGGHFDSVGGQSGSEFARLDIDTGLADVDWNPYVWSYSPPVPVTVHTSVITDHYLVVGGSFNRVGAESIGSLVAFSYESPPTPSSTPTPTPELTPEPSTKPDLSLTPTPTVEPTSKPKANNSESEEEEIQIPHAIKKLFSLLVVRPINDSNTNGQEVLSIVFQDTLDFDAFLSSIYTNANRLVELKAKHLQTTTNPSSNLLIAGSSSGGLMGFNEKGIVYWQVSNLQQIFYKAYPAEGKQPSIIIPEIQHKPSIIALKYEDKDLIPPGRPNFKFSELKLKLAHSVDGINWRILPTSVVDPINKTVAAIDKIGGYYTIAGTF